MSNTPFALLICALALGYTTSATADDVIVMKYLSNKDTTMTMYYRSEQNIRIVGRGRFSTYEADCSAQPPDRIHCRGVGTRTNDRKRYVGRYDFTTRDRGQTLVSKWRATYDDGENYSGTTRWTRTSMTGGRTPAPPSPPSVSRGTHHIAGTWREDRYGETLRIGREDNDPFMVELGSKDGRKGSVISGRWVKGKVGRTFRFKHEGKRFTCTYDPAARVLRLSQGGTVLGRFRYLRP